MAVAGLSPDWHVWSIATNTTLDAKESRRLKPFIEWSFGDALVEACRQI
jgi:hypothetical protein